MKRAFLRVFTPLIGFFQRKYHRWLAKRAPEQKTHITNRNNILIYPSRFGLFYLVFISILFILGTNYQNNIILLLSYLLSSFFITTMLHSFYNFSQIQFYSQARQYGYTGEDIYFPVKISVNKKHYDINLHFTQAREQDERQKVICCSPGTQHIDLKVKLPKRGQFLLGRVTAYSEYAFGLFKSKVVLDFGHNVIVYPKPIRLMASQYSLSAQREDSDLDNNQLSHRLGTDDFFELKSFVQGESRSRTAWKQLAKGQGHFSKHYQASQGKLQWLNLHDMPGNDIEMKLNYLSFLINEFGANNQEYGLLLYPEDINNTLNISPNSGGAHQQDCLSALALYS